MKHKIKLSEIVGIEDFAGKAASHAVELKAWRTHMSRVKQDEANSELAPFQRHIAYPRPRAHIAIEKSIDENDEANFEIVDDSPSIDPPDPQQALAAAKLNLLSLLYHAEQIAISKILPAGKRRLFGMRENDLAKVENDAYQAAMNKLGWFSKATTKPDQVMAAIRQNRSPSDQHFLDDQQQRRQQIDAIERAAAQASHDIEDLTADTIGSWKTPSF
jgi:hypothetical protein